MSKHIGSFGLRAIVENAFAGVAFAATVAVIFAGTAAMCFPGLVAITTSFGRTRSRLRGALSRRKNYTRRCGGTVYAPVD